MQELGRGLFAERLGELLALLALGGRCASAGCHPRGEPSPNASRRAKASRYVRCTPYDTTNSARRGIIVGDVEQREVKRLAVLQQPVGEPVDDVRREPLTLFNLAMEFPRASKRQASELLREPIEVHGMHVHLHVRRNDWREGRHEPLGRREHFLRGYHREVHFVAFLSCHSVALAWSASTWCRATRASSASLLDLGEELRADGAECERVLSAVRTRVEVPVKADADGFPRVD